MIHIGGEVMKKMLDKMFCNKKLSILIPILIAVVIYLLFILFGNSDNKLNTIIALPIISAIWFFGVFFIMLIQVKNTLCPEWFLNFFELIVIIIFGICAIFSTVHFISSGFCDLEFGLCMGLLTFSAVSWVHNKRKK